ncbi:hypothetical protein Aperf_G00000097798 [Anoplocephala perfoliata]
MFGDFDDVSLSQVKDDLGAFGLSVTNNEILKQFLGLSNKHCLSPSKLVEKYVAFRHNRGLSDCLDAANVNLFEKENLIPSVVSKTSRASEVKLSDSLNVLPSDMRKEMFMHQQPLVKSEILDSWTWDQVKRVVESLPSTIIDSDTEILASQKPRFSLSSVLEGSQKQRDTHESKKPATSALRPIHSRIQTPSLVAGRIAICPETVPAEGVIHDQRLDTANVCIIGTRRVGGGDLGKVMLDITTNAANMEYSLYTGQPVVLRASNVTGRSLTAFEFFRPKVLPVFDAKNTYMSSDEPDLHVAVACGPFTTNTSHEITPLLSLLKRLKERRPHVLVLLGALVDASHPLIAEYCESTLDELYQTRLNTVVEWCYLLKIKLIVVSSYREACGSPVYPTPPQFTSKPPWALKNPDLATWYEDVTFVWDPSTLKIGPYYIGVTSADILFQMSSEETSANCTGDRFSRLCRHILTSGTYYPVHPAAEDLPLDYPLWWEHARLPSEHSPHCIILPSRLRCFIKDVDGVVCVNPGLTSRVSGTSGGSYARLVFSSKSSDPDLASEDQSIRGPVTVQGEGSGVVVTADPPSGFSQGWLVGNPLAPVERVFGHSGRDGRLLSLMFALVMVCYWFSHLAFFNRQAATQTNLLSVIR